VKKKENSITIVLPLLDREIYTPTWIKENLFQDFNYIIADGSKNDANRLIFEKLHNRSNIKYIRYPFDASISDYVKKMSDAISRVETSYVMTCDNDDFLGYRGIIECVNALNRNETVGFCNGNVRNVTGIDIIKKNNIYQNKYRLRPDGVVVDNLDQMYGIEGVKKLFQPYKYVWYGIYRTELYKKIWDEILLSKIENIFLIEYLQGQLAFCFSKMMYVNRTHYIRLTNPISNSAKEHTPDEYPSQHKIYFDDSYRAEVLRMGEIVSDALFVDKHVIYALYRTFYANQYSYFIKTNLKTQLINAIYDRIFNIISIPLPLSFIRKIV